MGDETMGDEPMEVPVMMFLLIRCTILMGTLFHGIYGDEYMMEYGAAEFVDGGMSRTTKNRTI